MYGYIYKTTNLVNNKMYIGQHKSEKFDETYLGSGIALKRAIKKYGKESFKVELLECCDNNDELNERERFWIKEFDAVKSKKYYNMSDGGEDVDSATKIGHIKLSKIAKKNFNKLLKTIDESEFKLFYRTHSISEIKIKYNLTEQQYRNLRKYYKLSHTQEEINMIVKRKTFEKYGCENVFQSEKIKEKSRKTKLEKYNDENYSNREGAKKTCKNRYGNECVFLVADIKDKGNQSLIKRYGSMENYHKIQRKQAVETMIKNDIYKDIAKKSKDIYNKKSSEEKKLIRDKTIKTCLERYGVVSPSQLPSHKDKCKKKIGKKAYNNGTVTKMFFENDVPEGWIRGSLRVKKQ